MHVPASERLRHAWHRRTETDYRFDFWTAFGWTLLTCGIFSYYIAYPLCRRMRDHNIRRLQLLEAANEQAWERAVAAGRGEELAPAFQRVAADLDVLRRMTGDFRDPALWLVLVLISSGIGLIVLAGRIVAVFASCGVYAYWWLFNSMDDGNRHFARDWAWEDAFVPAVA